MCLYRFRIILEAARTHNCIERQQLSYDGNPDVVDRESQAIKLVLKKSLNDSQNSVKFLPKVFNLHRTTILDMLPYIAQHGMRSAVL